MTMTVDRAGTGRATGDAPSGQTLEHRRWQRVCRVDELEAGWGEAVLIAERQVALFRLDDSEVYAVDHIDPKTSAPVIARGIVGSKGERCTVASPLLKQVYDLATGECLSEPGPALTTYRTRIVAGFVEIESAA
jgi:nitrite reductase (NADH) small subunit